MQPTGVWRNLRNTRDKNDFFLTLQYHQDDVRGSKGKKYAKTNVVETTSELEDGKAVDAGGKSISFVVPWRSMQAQRRELREKEKELAEALVMLVGEVDLTGKRMLRCAWREMNKNCWTTGLTRTQNSRPRYKPPSRRTHSSRSATSPQASAAKCPRWSCKWPTTRPSRTARTSTPAAR